jgi:hypothetical protein
MKPIFILIGLVCLTFLSSCSEEYSSSQDPITRSTSPQENLVTEITPSVQSTEPSE